MKSVMPHYCVVDRQCWEGMSRGTLRTGVSIPSEISFVASLDSNGATKAYRTPDDRKNHGRRCTTVISERGGCATCTRRVSLTKSPIGFTRRLIAMPPPLSPDLGSHLLKATRSRDLDEALETVLTEYLTLKIEKLQQTTNRLEKKWEMSFSTFKRRLSENDLSEDAYSQEVEEDFWEWEEAETLKAHYQKVQEEWT